MSLQPHESDLLREMVRQVLLEVVPKAMGGAAGAPVTETVVLASDADLQAFARRIASASTEVRESIAAGTTLFRLAGPAAAALAPSSVPTSTARPEVRVESGAVTERHVRDAAAKEAVLVLGRKAVLTPLARDRARAARVEITREK